MNFFENFEFMRKGVRKINLKGKRQKKRERKKRKIQT